MKRVVICLLTFCLFALATVDSAEIVNPTRPSKHSTACLKAHNDKRKLHGAQALAWDAGLAQHAKDWAAELVKLGKLQHAANRPGEGENLFWGMKSKGTYDCADAVKAWYDEVKDYPFKNPPTKLSDVPQQIGHFTQVVWKATTKVGVGVATTVNGRGQDETYIVARYTPPGNYQGQYAANVGNKVDASLITCYTCTDCGSASGEGTSCPAGLDKCLTISGAQNGTTRSCANQEKCATAENHCKDNQCTAECCASDLCNKSESGAGWLPISSFFVSLSAVLVSFSFAA